MSGDFWGELSPKAREILTRAAEHPRGLAYAGRLSTAARSLAKRGLVTLVASDCVQITDAGEAYVASHAP